MARTGPAITRRKDGYQLRAASASQPKTLKRYACAHKVTDWMISDPDGANSGLTGLSNSIARKPYPSIEQLRDMQATMSFDKPNLLDVAADHLIDDRLVRKLDEDGFIDRIYTSYKSP